MEKISYYKKYLILVFCLLLLAASTIAFFKLNNEKTIYSNSVSGSCKFSC